MKIRFSLIISLMFIASAVSIEFQGTENIQNLKHEYEALRARMSGLKKDHDTDSTELSMLMQKQLQYLNEAISMLDNLHKDKATIENWMERQRRAYEIRYSLVNSKEETT